MQDGNRGDHTADGWRDRFVRADRLTAMASADERRRRGREFEEILGGMLREAGLAPRISRMGGSAGG
jgi:hypothetical protein